MTPPLRTLLACWLAVTATGMVVSHRHDGAPSHTHGWGWVQASLPSALGGPLLSHRHIVLLGIESGATPDVPDSSGRDAPTQVVPAFDASSPGEGGSGDSPDGPSLPATAVAPFDVPANVPPVGNASTLTHFLRPADQPRSVILRL